MSIFLSDEDLHRLTGYLQPKAQCQWLDKNNFTYTTNARKKPRLTVKQVESREVQSVDKKIDEAPNITKLESFKKRGNRC